MFVLNIRELYKHLYLCGNIQKKQTCLEMFADRLFRVHVICYSSQVLHFYFQEKHSRCEYFKLLLRLHILHSTHYKCSSDLRDRSVIVGISYTASHLIASNYFFGPSSCILGNTVPDVKVSCGKISQGCACLHLKCLLFLSHFVQNLNVLLDSGTNPDCEFYPNYSCDRCPFLYGETNRQTNRHNRLSLFETSLRKRLKRHFIVNYRLNLFQLIAKFILHTSYCAVR
jgi:hypothetical protein